MPNRIAAIDGLRGLAILMVIYQHCYAVGVILALASVTSLYPWLVTNGWMGVGLFFVISGFVLALPFENGSRALDSRADYADFMVRRMRRLWPMLAIGAGIGFVYLTATQGPLLGSFLLTISTLSMFTSDQFFAAVFPVGWSLMVEVWASAMLPFIILAARRYGWARVLIAVLVLSLVVRLLGTQQEFINFHVRPVKDSVLGRIDDFVVGAYIAHLYARGRLPAARAGWIAIGGVLAAFVLADLCTMHVLPEVFLPLINNAAQIGFGFAIIAALRPGRFASVLAYWPLQLAGAMSYSLYVWHAFVRGPQFMAEPFDLWLNVSFWIPFLILSAVTYKFVEFPRMPAASAFRLGGTG